MPFVYTGFLWGLAALAVPLWLHLSRRRNYRKLPVGTLRFLEEVLRERRKRSRIEEWPLLLLRLLCFAALVLLFMRPFRNAPQAAEGKRMATVVLVDASGSVTPAMAEEGRKSIREVLQKARDGEKITLLQFSDAAEEIPGPESWQPRAGAPTDWTKALDQALDRLSQLPPGGTGRIVAIGHFTAGDLPSAPPKVWPPGVSLELRPLTPPNISSGPQSGDQAGSSLSVGNAAVLGVSLLTPYVTEQMEIEASVSLPAGADRTVVLEAEGLSLSQTLPAGAERLIFRFHPPRPEVRGVIRVAGGDAWPADDQRAFAVRWLEPRKILLVDSHPGSTPYAGQAYFLQKALTASGAVHGKTPFQPEIGFGLSGRGGPVDLSGYAAVALCGLPQLSASDAERLAAFAAGGGGVITFLDGRWTPELANALTSAGLAPAEGKSTSSSETRHLVQWSKDHPALASFDGADGGDLRTLEWRDGFNNFEKTAGWRSLATLEGGHALLLEKQNGLPSSGTGSGMGSGFGPGTGKLTPDQAPVPASSPDSAQTKTSRILLFAHPMTREWTDIPREPLFVPLVKNLFAWLAKTETGLPEVPPLTPGLREARAPGLYTAQDGSPVVVAAAASESAVAPASPEAFRSAFGVPDEAAVKAAAAQAQAEILSSATRSDQASPEAMTLLASRQEFWPWVALLLLLLLMAETLLATRRKASAA